MDISNHILLYGLSVFRLESIVLRRNVSYEKQIS